MVKNVDQRFPKPKMMSSNVLICSPERNQIIFTFTMLKSKNFTVFLQKKSAQTKTHGTAAGAYCRD